MSARYAIVDADHCIVQLLDEPVPAGEGWGHTREMIALVQDHQVGDTVQWDEHGVETTA